MEANKEHVKQILQGSLTHVPEVCIKPCNYIIYPCTQNIKTIEHMLFECCFGEVSKTCVSTSSGTCVQHMAWYQKTCVPGPWGPNVYIDTCWGAQRIHRYVPGGPLRGNKPPGSQHHSDAPRLWRCALPAESSTAPSKSLLAHQGLVGGSSSPRSHRP